MPFISILAISHFSLLVCLYYFFSNFIVPTFYWLLVKPPSKDPFQIPKIFSLTL